MDMRLFSRTGLFADEKNTSEFTEGGPLESSPASGVEVLGNKVVKFLLTGYGTDVLSPTYGARAFQHTNISRAYIPQLTLELQQDIARCVSFIKDSEISAQSTTQLDTILLREVRYDDKLSPDRLDVFIEIFTTDNNSVLVHVPASVK